MDWPSLPVQYVASQESVAGLLSLSRVWIQEQHAVGSDVREIKHLSDGIGHGIERSLPDALPAQPVIFNKVDDRRLVGYGVIHEVRTRPRRNYQQGLSRSVPAASQSMSIRRIHSRKCGRGRTAGIRPSQSIRPFG